MKRKKISNEEISEEEIREVIKKKIEMFIEQINEMNNMIGKEIYGEVRAYPYVYVLDPYLEKTSDKKNKILSNSVADMEDKVIITIEVVNKDYEIEIKNKRLIVNTEDGFCKINLPKNVNINKRKEEYNNGVLTITFEKKNER